LTNPDDIEQFRQSFRSVLDPQPKAVCGETVSGDGSVYRGTAATQALKPGLRVFSLNLEAREDVCLEIEPNAPGFFFSLVLDGRSHWSQGAPDRASPNLSLSPGSNVFAGHHGDEQHWRIQAGHSHRIVELHLSVRTAVELFSEYLDPLPKDFRNVVMERADSFESVWRPLTPALRAAVNQILSCPMEGPLRRLFIESKALEILALELDLLASQVAHKQLKISRSDRDKLAHAAQILEAELDNPPGLLELARRAGLNDFKLKRGFRVQFGESVFGYLRSLRMEKARAMLSESDANVSEVAVAVGYSSFGHFTAAFRKQFGVLPKDLKKRPRL
jgi:AraC-like DNA-binding protein